MVKASAKAKEMETALEFATKSMKYAALPMLRRQTQEQVSQKLDGLQSRCLIFRLAYSSTRVFAS